MIHIIGGRGFIGQTVLGLCNPSDVIIWSHQSNGQCGHFDLNNQDTWVDLFASRPQRVLLLSWPGLPNYQSTHHLTDNMTASLALIEGLARSGLQHLVVTGTCYEYGDKNGILKTDDPTTPNTFYGIAKDSLNKSLSIVAKENNFRYCWARIFYIYGPGQSERSLYPSLIKADRNDKKEFAIANPDLLRDFVSSSEVASMLLKLLYCDAANGIFNCGSGRPISIRSFAESIINKYNLKIKLRCGSEVQRAHESLASWADMEKWQAVDRELNRATNRLYY